MRIGDNGDVTGMEIVGEFVIEIEIEIEKKNSCVVFNKKKFVRKMRTQNLNMYRKCLTCFRRDGYYPRWGNTVLVLPLHLPVV